jgi:hypothetical protein
MWQSLRYDDKGQMLFFLKHADPSIHTPIHVALGKWAAAACVMPVRVHNTIDRTVNWWWSAQFLVHR